MKTSVTLEGDAMKAFGKGGSIARATIKAMRKAASTGARDMKSAAQKHVRSKKRLKVKTVNKALSIHRNKGRTLDDIEFGVDIRGNLIKLSAYPFTQLKKGRGVSVRVNKGQSAIYKSAFVATMSSGHRGVFVRRGKARIPIKEPYSSRPLDVLDTIKDSAVVLAKGQSSFNDRFDELFPMELEKEKSK